MSPRGRIMLAGLIVLAAGFLVLLVQLFMIRYEFGDNYPEYSSLRCDPLGTAVIYESLAESQAGQNDSKLSVDRNYLPMRRFSPPPETTVFMFGVHIGYSPGTGKKDVIALEKFVRDGGRLVIALAPQKKNSTSTSQPSSMPASIPFQHDPADDADDEDDEDSSFIVAGISIFRTSLLQRWGVEVKTETSDVKNVAKPDAAFPGLPETAWPGGLRFSISGSWRTVYKCQNAPVIVERHFGKGRIILAADSYFASNEAMKNTCSASLVAWMVGQYRSIIFDETHLGVKQEIGIADLARQYNLGGVILGLVVLAGLYLWKSMVRLVPPRSRADGGNEPQDIIEGMTSGEGLIQLLSRAIGQKKLLDTCLDEWEKSVSIIGVSDEKLKKIKMELPHIDPEKPVNGYKTIAGLLKERK